MFYIIFRIADGNFSYLSSSNTQGIFLLSNFAPVERMKKKRNTDFPKFIECFFFIKYLDCKLIPQRMEPLYSNVIAIVGGLNFNLFSGCQGQGIIWQNRKISWRLSLLFLYEISSYFYSPALHYEQGWLILTNHGNDVILCWGWCWQLFVVIITINLSRGIDIPSNSPTPETDSIICYQDKLTTTDNIIIIVTTTRRSNCWFSRINYSIEVVWCCSAISWASEIL